MLQALDKIRFEGLTDKSKLESQPELFIHILPDKANNSLTIVDSGIGMTKAGKVSHSISFRFLSRSVEASHKRDKQGIGSHVHVVNLSVDCFSVFIFCMFL